MRQEAFLLLVTLVICTAPVAAVNGAEHEHEKTHEAAHDFHPNMLGLFIGTTQEGSEEDFTLGLEYERRFNKSFGIGVFAEKVTGDLDFWVYGVPFAYHTGRWKLYVAPGVEDGEHGSEFLARIGGEYAFEVGEWEISPQLNVDFVDSEEVWVFGFVIGKGF
jgi:hypothetical protein